MAKKAASKKAGEAAGAKASKAEGKSAKAKAEKRQDSTKAVKAKRAVREAEAKPSSVAKAGKAEGGSPAGLLARAEEDMSKLLESLNTQMSAAMHVFTELAAAQRGKHEAVIRTKPLDRATAMFQRLVTEMMDERLGEILPTLVALRLEMGQRSRMGGDGSPEVQEFGEFLSRGTEMLDQVLANVDVQPFEPKTGDAFDPLIHLAVGEVYRSDLAGDVVAEVLQQGYRSTRGKVVHAARVRVNRV